MRIENDKDKELYILASLAEIEVQITLGQKIQEIINETLYGKINLPGSDMNKMGIESQRHEKVSSPRKKL